MIVVDKFQLNFTVWPASNLNCLNYNKLFYTFPKNFKAKTKEIKETQSTYKDS